jgi:hypothetical protein
VKGELLPPQVQLQVREGVPTKVTLPTFVSIANPQPAAEFRTTYAGITVWIDVDPTVTLHPGEPGAAAKQCGDRGTAYNPSGASPRAQAQAAGACAHFYTHRTGVAGRPAAWTGDVTITWAVTWDSSEPGQNGTLDAAPSTTNFQRVVQESQGVVTRAGG